MKSSTGSGLELRVDWSATSNQSSKNSSVKVEVYVEHASIYVSALSGSYLRVGTTQYPFATGLNYTGSNTATKIHERTVTVPHNSDGQCTVEIGAAWRFGGIYNGYAIDTLEVCEKVALDPINIYSTATLDATRLVAGEPVKVKINSTNSSFTHRIQFTVGSKNVYSSKLTGAAPSCTVPANLAEGLLNSSKGSVTLKLHTYGIDGSWIGQANLGQFEFIIPENETFAPTFSVSAVPYSNYEAVDGAGVFIFGGGARFQITSVTTKHKATVSSCFVSAFAKKVEDRTPTTSYTLYYSFEKVGEHSFTVSVTDSRGISGIQTVSINVQNYRLPTVVSGSAKRCNSLGEDDDKGEGLKVIAMSSHSVLTGFSNGVVLSVSVTKRGESTPLWQNNMLSDMELVCPVTLSVYNSYQVVFTATDTVGNSHSLEIIVPTTKADFHLKNGAARFGGYCEREGFECDWNVNFGGEVSLGGNTLSDFVAEWGSDGIWTWRKWKSGIAECFGTTAVKSYTLEAAFGGLYISRDAAQNNNSVAYPENLFVSAPCIQATPAHKEFTYFLLPRSNGSASVTPHYYIVGESSSATYNCSMSLYAVGNWK